MRWIIAVLLFVSVVGAQVTERDIDAAEEAVRAAEANLAALQGQQTAEVAQAQIDSTLTANRVRVIAYEKDLGGMYVYVDVPYTAWTELQQAKWDVLLERTRELKIKPSEVVGRYSIRKDRLPEFLKRIKSFLGSD